MPAPQIRLYVTKHQHDTDKNTARHNVYFQGHPRPRDENPLYTGKYHL